MRLGVINVGGTYEPSALPAPVAQLGEIYKVAFQIPISRIEVLKSIFSCSTLPSFFSYQVSH